MKKAIFRDSGWKAEVEILEDRSNEQEERYVIKVIKTIRESRWFGRRPDGDVFEVMSNRKYDFYSGWSLEELEDDHAN